MSRKITRRDLRKMILNEIRLLSEGFSLPMFQKDLDVLMDGYGSEENLLPLANAVEDAFGLSPGLFDSIVGLKDNIRKGMMSASEREAEFGKDPTPSERLAAACSEVGMSLPACLGNGIAKEAVSTFSTGVTNATMCYYDCNYG